MKRLSLLMLFYLLFNNLCAQTGTIKGVVTYYFNVNFGYKPDIGANVQIMKPENPSLFMAELESCNKKEYQAKYLPAKLEYSKSLFDYESRPAFTNAKKIKELRNKKDEAKKVVDKYSPDVMKAENCEKDVIRKFLARSEFVTQTSVDGVGNYSISLSPAKYFVVINSLQRTPSRAIKYIDLTDNSTFEFSNGFHPDDDYIKYIGF